MGLRVGFWSGERVPRVLHTCLTFRVTSLTPRQNIYWKLIDILLHLSPSTRNFLRNCRNPSVFNNILWRLSEDCWRRTSTWWRLNSQLQRGDDTENNKITRTIYTTISKYIFKQFNNFNTCSMFHVSSKLQVLSQPRALRFSFQFQGVSVNLIDDW